LYGLENISAHDGWAIALVGVTIVFTGLTLLSLTIAQLHKVLDIWENKGNYINNRNNKGHSPLPDASLVRKEPLPTRDRETIRQYKLLIDRLEQPFSLPKLIELAEKVGIEKPHSTINDLLQKKIIVADKKGYYIWLH
jgi:hypothetical protein